MDDFREYYLPELIAACSVRHISRLRALDDDVYEFTMRPFLYFPPAAVGLQRLSAALAELIFIEFDWNYWELI